MIKKLVKPVLQKIKVTIRKKKYIKKYLDKPAGPDNISGQARVLLKKK